MQLQRQGDLVHAFVELADTLVTGYDVDEWLQQLVEHCVDLLGVSESALLLADSSGHLRVAASSSDQMRRLQVFQVQTQDGPCLECFARHEPVIAESPQELERRWPVFASAMAEQDLMSVAVVPLRLREDSVGALGLFSDQVRAPDAMDVMIAQGLADIATIGILQARAIHDSRAVTVQLQTALDTRIVIEQAKGVVATQTGITVTEAFSLMRGHARGHGLRLAAVAASLVRGELRGEQL